MRRHRGTRALMSENRTPDLTKQLSFIHPCANSVILLNNNSFWYSMSRAANHYGLRNGFVFLFLVLTTAEIVLPKIRYLRYVQCSTKYTKTYVLVNLFGSEYFNVKLKMKKYATTIVKNGKAVINTVLIKYHIYTNIPWYI